MSKLYRIVVLFVLAILIASCAAPAVPVPTLSPSPAPQIARHPKLVSFGGTKGYNKLPQYDPNSTDPWQLDFRSVDLSEFDLSSYKDLWFADFDSKTEWPLPDKMLAGFDPQKIMEIGKDPGLGVRALHEKGITGTGVGIAIIDQPLLIEHIEYTNRFRLYEEINVASDVEAQMHGPAVASIAAGKNIGIAPDADLYYIATWAFDPSSSTSQHNFHFYAQAVKRIIEINKQLPADRKIRVVSMSVGWGADEVGYEEITEAVKEAKANGIFAISVNLFETYGFHFQGMGREPLSDPNQFESYLPPTFWSKYFYEGRQFENTLLIPMDSRTTASPTGINNYVFYREGGLSWTIPYIAGTYALAAQVKPDITPEIFWDTALKTGKTIQIQHDGKSYEFGVILDPQALIKALQGK